LAHPPASDFSGLRKKFVNFLYFFQKPSLSDQR